MSSDEARELWRLAKVLVVVTPLVIGWCSLVRWLGFKIADRWFR